jgi:hypothetical protein
MPLASISYTIFAVNLLLLITHTASAPLSFHNLYASKDMSGFPCVRVFQMIACASLLLTLSTMSWPNVCSGLGAVHNMRHGTFWASITARHGPMPEPVATRTTDLNNVAMRRTPQVGMPRMYMCVGADSMVRPVKSPARLTMSEKPLPLGFVMVAKPCLGIERSASGLETRRRLQKTLHNNHA